MIQGRCPTCGKEFDVDRISDSPGFPFCSNRCKLIDLGRWIDGSYTIPVVPDRENEESDVDESDD